MPDLLERWRREFFDRSGFELFPAAADVLAEFGGVSVHQSGPGLDVARADFIFDPTEASGEEDRFARFEKHLRTRLCPLGMCDARHFFLALATDGRVVSLMDDGRLIGDGLEQGLESLVLGKLGEPVYLE